MHIPEGALDWLVTSLKTSHEDKKEYHDRIMDNLKREHKRLEIRIEKMYEDKLDGRITNEIYDKKFKEYEKKKEDLLIQMQKHDDASESYYIDACKVLELASRACEIFESSEPEEKRQLLRFLLQNCELRGKNLRFTVKKPYDLILSHAKTQDWLPG